MDLELWDDADDISMEWDHSPVTSYEDMTGGNSGLQFVPRHNPQQDAVITHPRLKLTEYRRSFEVRHNLNEVDIMSIDTQIDDAFRDLIQPVRDEAAANDLVGVTVNHSDLTRPIFLTFTRNSIFNTQSFTNRIYEVTQSNATFLLDGILTVSCISLEKTYLVAQDQLVPLPIYGIAPGIS